MKCHITRAYAGIGYRFCNTKDYFLVRVDPDTIGISSFTKLFKYLGLEENGCYLADLKITRDKRNFNFKLKKIDNGHFFDLYNVRNKPLLCFCGKEFKKYFPGLSKNMNPKVLYCVRVSIRIIKKVRAQ